MLKLWAVTNQKYVYISYHKIIELVLQLFSFLIVGMHIPSCPLDCPSFYELHFRVS
jgi:hypothetical protein